VPLTVPTHPAVVLPLKIWRPRWFDGVALVVGSIAPDLGYALDGSGLPVWRMSHGLRGFALWCLPVTFALTWLIRWAAPVVARHLPGAGEFALRDYGLLGHRRHGWVVTAGSALLGAVSHLATDWLELVVPGAEYVMHGLGVVGLLAVLRHIGQRRLLREWYGTPAVGRARPALFWSVAAVVTLSGAAVTAILPGASMMHTTAVRLLCSAGAGVLVAALAVSRCRPSRSRPSVSRTAPRRQPAS
jgi:hypothetical protein